jgi:outer membrane receptor protein involved in Fe transport
VSPEEWLLASVTVFFHEGRKTLIDINDKNVRPVDLGLDLIFKELLEEQLGFYGYQKNLGRQRSYGIETAVRWDRPTFRAMANFSWSRAKRKYDPMLNPSWMPYGLDQPLRLNLLFATTAFRWNFGSRLTMVSGNPLTFVPAGTPVTEEEPKGVLQRLPTFWQLDIRIDRTWDSDWGNITLFFDLQNVTNHRNIEYRDTYPSEEYGNVYVYEDVRGLPIIPYIGVEFAPR